jgi:hypothetical protein
MNGSRRDSFAVSSVLFSPKTDEWQHVDMQQQPMTSNKAGAPKDKACPFCRQQFTSSSQGRHLDLYIKEKNPMQPDGVHDVDEIRKLRGRITRKQPRNSTSKREGSTGEYLLTQSQLAANVFRTKSGSRFK